LANLLKQKYRRARHLAQFYSFFGNRKLILAASMPRSASTWMYNVTRILLQQKYGDDLAGGWIKDYHEMPKKPVSLVKIHHFDAAYARRANTVLYSYRDVRDSFASSIRKFNVKPRVKYAHKLIRYDEGWKNAADCVMRYEDFVENQAQEIRKIADTLDIKNYSVENILQQIADLKGSAKSKEKSHDKQSLFHKNHATTKGGHGNWSSEINGELLHQIETECREWFIENEYPLGSP